MLKKAFHLGFKTIILLFAIAGALFIGVFFAIKFHWTDEAGGEDVRSQAFQAFYEQQEAELANSTAIETTSDSDDANSSVLGVKKTELAKLSIDDLTTAELEMESLIDEIEFLRQQKQLTLCQIQAIAQQSGPLSTDMLRVYMATQSDTLIERMSFAASEYMPSTYIEEACTEKTSLHTVSAETIAAAAAEHGKTKTLLYPWSQTEEWNTISEALKKDADLINTIAQKVDIEPRLLATPLAVEQLRLFHTQRALFKQFFQPLNILASATKTSWGVMSIKEQTAIGIEEHLTDVNSPYYLGEEYEHMLDFTTTDHASERYERLTREHDHTYAYLYGALYIKQLLTQWERAGYPIEDRPEIVSTLFNIGFSNSEPKAVPAVGGASMDIQGTQYTFGSLGYEFFYSAQLMDEFPYNVEVLE